MKVLVVGGTGVIGEGILPELRARGHLVRLLSRHAADAAREWPDGIEPFPADVADADGLHGAADGCDVVIHVAGIVEESSPELTFERINVEGVRNTLAESRRSAVRRFVYVSSLGADRGASPYHRSKLHAEGLVRAFPREWVILRPGNVYGPGDEMMSKLLRFVRALPAVPVIERGDQRFQPVWFRDLGRAIARSVEMERLAHRTLELAGDEVTTMNDLLERFAAITGKDPVRIPIPSSLAQVGVHAAEALGVSLPLGTSRLTMLLEENVIEPPATNALLEVFGITPTPLAEGLRLLADATPEQLPSEGVGALEEKRFWADIAESPHSARELVRLLRRRITEIIPIEFAAEPGTPQEVELGVTLTAALPLRGNIQMRVEEVSEDAFTFATLKGHPLAGVVRFSAEDAPDGVCFAVTVYARPAGPVDWLVMQTIGKAVQRANWEDVVAKVVELSGGVAPGGVRTEAKPLDEAEARRAEAWIADLVTERKREEHQTGADPVE